MTNEGYEDFEDFMQDRLSNDDSSPAEQSPGGENAMAEEPEVSKGGGKSKCSEECGKIVIKETEKVNININCCPDS